MQCNFKKLHGDLPLKNCIDRARGIVRDDRRYTGIGIPAGIPGIHSTGTYYCCYIVVPVQC